LPLPLLAVRLAPSPSIVQLLDLLPPLRSHNSSPTSALALRDVAPPHMVSLTISSKAVLIGTSHVLPRSPGNSLLILPQLSLFPGATGALQPTIGLVTSRFSLTSPPPILISKFMLYKTLSTPSTFSHQSPWPRILLHRRRFPSLACPNPSTPQPLSLLGDCVLRHRP